MARGPRQQINERLDSSIKATQKIKEYLAINGESYAADGHGDIKAQYEVVFAFTQELENLLMSLRQTY